MRNPSFSRPSVQISAVVLDWAGTAVDFGSRAPVDAFMAAFAGWDIAVTAADVRGPMGRHKRDHLGALFALPHVAAQWQARYGEAPTEATIDAVYASFVPTQLGVLHEYATPIPGFLEVLAQWRAAGIRVGSTTGYTADMLKIVADSAAKQGYIPDHRVAADQATSGRPAPWMLWRNLEVLGVWPPAAVVKMGDTPADVAEGLNAGAWTVGLASCGNEVGLTWAEWSGLDATEQARLIEAARTKLLAAGVHYVADSWADVPAIFADINARLASGDRP